MTDTPSDADGEPTEASRPDHLEPPVAATVPTSEPPASEPPTVEAPATAPTAEVPVAAPVTAAPVVPADTPRRRGVMVPWWALAVVAALVVFGGGFLIGRAVGDDGHDGGVRVANPANPFGGNGNPFGGNGNGIPNPFGGNGNGNGGNGSNGNGGGSDNGAGGSTNAAPAFLGVGVTNSTDPAGVRVTTVVASGPASDAGLQRGDVITAVDGKSVTTMAALRSAIAAHKPGDDVKVTYTRNGAEKTLTVSLGDRTALSQ